MSNEPARLSNKSIHSSEEATRANSATMLAVVLEVVAAGFGDEALDDGLEAAGFFLVTSDTTSPRTFLIAAELNKQCHIKTESIDSYAMSYPYLASSKDSRKL